MFAIPTCRYTLVKVTSAPSAQEQAIDDYLRSKGLSPLENPDEALGKGDRIINGAPTEYKTLSGVRNPSASKLSGAVSNRAMNARSQAPHVVIDARNQAGMTPAVAQQGIIRAFGADDATATVAGENPKIESIRVILKDASGQDTDIFAPRRH